MGAQRRVCQNVLAGMLGQWGLLRSAISLLWPRDRQRAEKVLAELGLADKVLERTSHLSGGEQQRVAIARLMVQSPRIVLADEPVSSLDPVLSEEILRLLTGIADSPGRTLVASLHSPNLIRRYFTRVIGLREGVLQFDMPSSGLTDDVLAQLYGGDVSGAVERAGAGELVAEVSCISPLAAAVVVGGTCVEPGRRRLAGATGAFRGRRGSFGFSAGAVPA